MKNFCFLLFLVLSTNTFANTDKWYGTYHYYSSEELSGGNVATIESVLALTPKSVSILLLAFKLINLIYAK